MWPVSPRYNLLVLFSSGLLVLFGLLFTQRVDAPTRLAMIAFVGLLMTFAFWVNRRGKRHEEAMNRRIEEIRKRQRELENKDEEETD